jgi:hypothetical protein
MNISGFKDSQGGLSIITRREIIEFAFWAFLRFEKGANKLSTRLAYAQSSAGRDGALGLNAGVRCIRLVAFIPPKRNVESSIEHS